MQPSPRSSPKSSAKPRSARRAALAAAAVAALLLAAGAGSAYVRIVINGKLLTWSSATLSWNLHAAGSADIADGSHAVAVQKAFDAWEGVAGSRVAFTRGPDLATGPDGSGHVVMFDESNETGYFPPNTGIVALTPISYELGSGAILDADVIFNARDYAWSTDGAPGTFDVQDVLTHEIGHFIGLDHAPGVSGTMWPYVAMNQWLHRSLSLDDRGGAIAVAETGAQTRLSGVIRRSGNPVAGAMVCAVNADDGRLAGAVLSAVDGSWVLKGAPIGNYFVYASPLEGAMSAGNLTGNGAVNTNFASAFYGGFGAPTLFVVPADGNVVCGNLTMPADAAMVETSASPYLLRRGQSTWVTVFGGGFAAGAMDFLVKSPYLGLASVQSGSNWVRALVTAAADAPTGSFDAYVRDPDGVFEAATGLIEIIADPPELLGLDRSTGIAAGGEVVTLTGTGFQDGAYVLFGGAEALAVEFVDAQTLRVTTPAAAPGPADVAVHNPDGQHVALDDAFAFTAQPVFAQVFPQAGQAAGGTTLLVNGSAFAPDLQIELDGQPLAVEWLSARLARVVTPAHAAGAVDLLLRNPGEPDTVAAGAFRFVADADPEILGFTPTRGPSAGGTRVRISGRNLGAIVDVRFGVDPLTALGGNGAKDVRPVSSARVDATTSDQASAGSYGLIVVAANGQAALASGFTFEGSGTTNPGGSGFQLPAGGCAGSLGTRAADARGAAGDGALALAWAAAFWLLRRRARAAR